MPTKKNTAALEEAANPNPEDALQKISSDAETGDSHQTDLENGIDAKALEPEINIISQTDAEEAELSAAGSEDALNPESNQLVSQTENETADIASTERDPELKTLTETQTEPEKPKQTRRRKSPDESQNQSDAEADLTQKKDDAASEEKPKLQISIPKRETVLAIDDELEVITDAAKAKDELLDLLESYRSKKHLSGTIQGIENASGDPSKALAVLNYGEYKIIIPLYEAVEPPDDLKGQPLDVVLGYMLSKRLGAEIDYVIKGIDSKAKIAVGSRIEAMRNKRKNYYFGTDRDGNYLLYSDLCAEVRVVSVVRSGIFVDLFGLEVFIPLRELSYQRMIDAETHFAPGQRALVKILEIDRTDRRNIHVRASVKQAAENPFEKALRKYTIGNLYVGTVSMVDINGVFVALDGGIDCLCNYPKRGRPPKGAQVAVKILGINHDTNRIWGVITHITAAR